MLSSQKCLELLDSGCHHRPVLILFFHSKNSNILLLNACFNLLNLPWGPNSLLHYGISQVESHGNSSRKKR